MKIKNFNKENNSSSFEMSLKKNKISSPLKKNSYSQLTISNKEKKILNYFFDPKYDLDIYTYEEALKYEKRTFIRIYYICLLSKERILNAFIFESKIKIKSLRISMFIFNNACDFALNAFFYTNEKISDKYHYNGDNLLWFTLLNNIIISISSAFFSSILVFLFNILTHSKNAIKDLLEKKNFIYINIIQKLQKIYKQLKIKIIIYIFLEFLLLLFFFYYVTGFCIVYKKSQIDWLLDGLVSTFVSILIKLLISFIISIFYLVSLKYKIKIIYNIVIFTY